MRLLLQNVKGLTFFGTGGMSRSSRPEMLWWATYDAASARCVIGPSVGTCVGGWAHDVIAACAWHDTLASLPYTQQVARVIWHKSASPFKLYSPGRGAQPRFQSWGVQFLRLGYYCRSREKKIRKVYPGISSLLPIPERYVKSWYIVRIPRGSDDIIHRLHMHCIIYILFKQSRANIKWAHIRTIK